MYEVWYNWEYAKEHNPSLMGFGYTGGYGPVRSQMRDHVKSGNKELAEECFWLLIKQSRRELLDDYREEHPDATFEDIEGFWADSLGYWMEDDAYSHTESNFIRRKGDQPEGKPWWKKIWQDMLFWGGIYLVFLIYLAYGYPGG